MLSQTVRICRIWVLTDGRCIKTGVAVGKSLLGSSPHDVIIYNSELQNAGVTRWSLHQNWGHGWKGFIILHQSRTVPYRFELSVGVWHALCEHYTNFSYKAYKIGTSCHWVRRWPNLHMIYYYKCHFFLHAPTDDYCASGVWMKYPTMRRPRTVRDLSIHYGKTCVKFTANIICTRCPYSIVGRPIDQTYLRFATVNDTFDAIVNTWFVRWVRIWPDWKHTEMVRSGMQPRLVHCSCMHEDQVAWIPQSLSQYLGKKI